MNFLIKLSQNKKVIVPIVFVMGLGIFGGSYFIQHNRDVAKQESEQQQTETETKEDNLSTLEPAEKLDNSIDDSSSEPETEVEKESENEQEYEKEHSQAAKVEVEVEVEGTKVAVVASTDKAGTCMISYKLGDSSKSDSKQTSNGKCTFTVDQISQVRKITGVFTDGSTTKGVGYWANY